MSDILSIYDSLSHKPSILYIRDNPDYTSIHIDMNSLVQLNGNTLIINKLNDKYVLTSNTLSFNGKLLYNRITSIDVYRSTLLDIENLDNKNLSIDIEYVCRGVKSSDTLEITNFSVELHTGSYPRIELVLNNEKEKIVLSEDLLRKSILCWISGLSGCVNSFKLFSNGNLVLNYDKISTKNKKVEIEEHDDILL